MGRDTRVTYEQIGADWLDGRKLAAFLNERSLPGVRAYPTRFQPTAYHFAHQTIDGVRFVITDRNALHSVRLGLEIIYALQRLYSGRVNDSSSPVSAFTFWRTFELIEVCVAPALINLTLSNGPPSSRA